MCDKMLEEKLLLELFFTEMKKAVKEAESKNHNYIIFSSDLKFVKDYEYRTTNNENEEYDEENYTLLPVSDCKSITVYKNFETFFIITKQIYKLGKINAD